MPSSWICFSSICLFHSTLCVEGQPHGSLGLIAVFVFLHMTIPHFTSPSLYRWKHRLLPTSSHSKQCWFEHSGACPLPVKSFSTICVSRHPPAVAKGFYFPLSSQHLIWQIFCTSYDLSIEKNYKLREKWRLLQKCHQPTKRNTLQIPRFGIFFPQAFKRSWLHEPLPFFPGTFQLLVQQHCLVALAKWRVTPSAVLPSLDFLLWVIWKPSVLHLPSAVSIRSKSHYLPLTSCPQPYWLPGFNFPSPTLRLPFISL